MRPLVLANKWTSYPPEPISLMCIIPRGAAGRSTVTSIRSEGSLRRTYSEILHDSRCSEQGAGLGGSEGIITGGDPHQERVLGGVLHAEVSQISSSLGHLDPPDTGL